MKRIILFYTKVLLDVLLDRKPRVDASAVLWEAVETRISEGLLAAHAVTTIHYLVGKEMGNVKAKRIVSPILGIFEVAMVHGAMTAAAARVANCDCIVTLDPKGFRGSAVPCLTPEALRPLL